MNLIGPNGYKSRESRGKSVNEGYVTPLRPGFRMRKNGICRLKRPLKCTMVTKGGLDLSRQQGAVVIPQGVGAKFRRGVG